MGIFKRRIAYDGLPFGVEVGGRDGNGGTRNTICPQCGKSIGTTGFNPMTGYICKQLTCDCGQKWTIILGHVNLDEVGNSASALAARQKYPEALKAFLFELF